MPRAVLLTPIVLLALISLAPASMGSTLIPDAVNGFATATTFQLFGVGRTIEGGPYDWTDVCAHCLIRITITGGELQVVDASDPQPIRTLTPGQYELREFRGVFGIYDFGPRDFQLEFHGTAKVGKLS